MAKYKDRDLAISLRKQGMSYSQIKEHLNVSKSSLSLWLQKYPLSQKRLGELRDHSEKRIENFRNTMRLKREVRLDKIFLKAKADVGGLSKRDIFIGGIFLYWGEGSKTRGSLTVTNTDPSVLKFFIKWLESVGVGADRLKVNLHLYKDMDIVKEVDFWSKILSISRKQFRRPYIKETESKSISYRNGFGHGTCSVILENKEMADYMLSCLRYIRGLY